MVRHPIYSGLLLMILGTAILGGQASGFVALLIVFCGFWVKLRQEEALLTKHLPSYYEYKGRTKALVPLLLGKRLQKTHTKDAKAWSLALGSDLTIQQFEQFAHCSYASLLPAIILVPGGIGERCHSVFAPMKIAKRAEPLML